MKEFKAGFGIDEIMKKSVMSVAISVVALFFVVPFYGIAASEKCDNDVVITIERTNCFGDCPVYSAQIYADGAVVYTGKMFVKETGERRFKIPQEKLQELIKEFERVDYFSLKDKYDAENGMTVTDLPTTTTSLCLDGRKKKVVNYYGAPKKLFELEDKIDLLAGLYKFLGPL